MSEVISTIGDGLWNAVLMAWEVWWALVLGLRDLGDRPGLGAARAHRVGAVRRGLAAVARATGLGAASSSCSYAAIAIAKSLFPKGAAAVARSRSSSPRRTSSGSSGLVLWVLLGWQFTLAEYLGGIVMIGLMWVTAAAFVSREPSARARARPARPTPATSTTRPATGWAGGSG